MRGPAPFAPRAAPRIGALRARAVGLESTAVLVACTVVALIVNWRLLHPNVFEGDAFVHEYWMWQWRDGALFNDPLTRELRDSARYPLGYQALFWAATQVVSPIVFGEWLGVALMALSGWLVFAIVREHAAWRPAAWTGAALFLALFDIHRFSGGFARAFVQPVVLGVVLLLLRRHRLAAALVAAGATLLYPPAAVLAVGVVVVSALRWERGPRIDRHAAPFAALAIGLATAGALGPRLVDGAAPAILTAAQARHYPEFAAHGTLHVFVGSVVEYLSQNRTGLDLRASGSIVVLAAVALLAARPANARLLRQPVVATVVVSLGAYALAQMLLFRLYLPHRYTYPLVAVAAIAVGVALLPTWQALSTMRPRRGRGREPALSAVLLAAPPALAAFAVHGFPLGPRESLSGLICGRGIALAVLTAALAAAGAVGLTRLPPARRATAGALVSAATILGLLLAVPAHPAPGWICPNGPTVRSLGGLPKGAIVAADPNDADCLPGTARRAVVISAQLAPSYEAAYFRDGRARMFAILRALYGPSRQAIVALRTRYGATHLWVRRDAVRAQAAGRGPWQRRAEPYGSFVRRLVAGGASPASLRLPRACRRFADGASAIYDLACVGRETRSSVAARLP